MNAAPSTIQRGLAAEVGQSDDVVGRLRACGLSAAVAAALAEAGARGNSRAGALMQLLARQEPGNSTQMHLARLELAQALELAAGLAAAGALDGALRSDDLLLLQQAASFADLRAQQQLRLLGLRDDPLPAPALLCHTPPIALFKRLLSAEACDWLVEAARGRLAPALVSTCYSRRGAVSPIRTNRSAGCPIADFDVVTAWARARLAEAAHCSIGQLEGTSILHYRPGEEFGRHFDFIEPSSEEGRALIASQGQRLATVFVYLSEDYEGGETDFPMPRLRFKGQKGDALLFRNVDEAGRPDRRTWHAGLAPISGDKWILAQFVRNRDWPLV